MDFLIKEENSNGIIGKPYKDLHKLFGTFSHFNENVKYISAAVFSYKFESKIEESKIEVI